jgi:L-asparaginase
MYSCAPAPFRHLFLYLSKITTIMKRLTALLAALAFILFTHIAFGQRPNVYILATGGTIAGTGASSTGTAYSAGQVAIQTLIDAVPQMQEIAQVRGEQVVNIGSQDMSDEVWLRLAERINELVQDPDIDGIVVTHGTDTMEETALFLDLSVNTPKPIVLTGAMRPSTALSADGPLNLFNAVVVAASSDSRDRGVLVAMNGQVHSAVQVIKMHTTSVESFASPNAAPLGTVLNGKVTYKASPEHTTLHFDITGLTALPKVGIIYSHAGISSDIATAMLSSGYQGIIHAGVGNGNIHKEIFPNLDQARANNIIVVRSSRVPTGPTTLENEVDDQAHQFVASQWLNPQKSRVLLMLALTRTHDWQQIQEYFNSISK